MLCGGVLYSRVVASRENTTVLCQSICYACQRSILWKRYRSCTSRLRSLAASHCGSPPQLKAGGHNRVAPVGVCSCGGFGKWRDGGQHSGLLSPSEVNPVGTSISIRSATPPGVLSAYRLTGRRSWWPSPVKGMTDAAPGTAGWPARASMVRWGKSVCAA